MRPPQQQQQPQQQPAAPRGEISLNRVSAAASASAAAAAAAAQGTAEVIVWPDLGYMSVSPFWGGGIYGDIFVCVGGGGG
jgi:hypothetical protein